MGSGTSHHTRRGGTVVRLLVLLGSVCAFAPALLEAQDKAVEDQMKVLRIPRVSRPPTLADFLNGVPREAEATITDFRQYRPGDGEPVSRPTARSVPGLRSPARLPPRPRPASCFRPEVFWWDTGNPAIA